MLLYVRTSKYERTACVNAHIGGVVFLWFFFPRRRLPRVPEGWARTFHDFARKQNTTGSQKNQERGRKKGPGEPTESSPNEMHVKSSRSKTGFKETHCTQKLAGRGPAALRPTVRLRVRRGQNLQPLHTHHHYRLSSSSTNHARNSLQLFTQRTTHTKA